jgi:hypothetical protein
VIKAEERKRKTKKLLKITFPKKDLGSVPATEFCAPHQADAGPFFSSVNVDRLT